MIANACHKHTHILPVWFKGELYNYVVDLQDNWVTHILNLGLRYNWIRDLNGNRKLAMI